MLIYYQVLCTALIALEVLEPEKNIYALPYGIYEIKATLNSLLDMPTAVSSPNLPNWTLPHLPGPV